MQSLSTEMYKHHSFKSPSNSRKPKVDLIDQENFKTRSPYSQTSTCCHSDREEDSQLTAPCVLQPITYDHNSFNNYHLSNRINNLPASAAKASNRKLKNELCKNYLEYGWCPYNNNCQFAHGQVELRQTNHNSNNKYKTKKCRSFFQNGFCTYGFRCNFIHRRNAGPNGQGQEECSQMRSIISRDDRDFVYQNYPQIMMCRKQQSRLFLSGPQDTCLDL